MAAQERPELTDAALDGILQRLANDFQVFTSRIADRQRAEQSGFEQQMSALQREKDTRQKEREAIQNEIKSLQKKLQDLDSKDDMDKSKAMQLQNEYKFATEKWKRAQQRWEAQLLGAFSPVEPIPLSNSTEPHPQDSPAAPGRAQGEVEWHSPAREDVPVRTSLATEALSSAPSKPGVLRHPEPVLVATNQQSSDDARNLRRRRPSSLSERDGDSEQPTNHARKKARNGERTIDFDDVFQDGNAENKHTIIEYPKDSRRWYILRCDQHCHFGRSPLRGAMKHLNGKRHGNLPKSGATAIERLGIRVENCDATKAKRNNLAFDRALDDGYEPFKTKLDQLSHPETGKGPESASDEASHDPPPTMPRKQGAFEGITDPAVGEVYRVLFEGRYYAVLMLPTGGFESVGMAGSIAETELARYIPACYLSDMEKKIIHGWADRYRDGGPLTQKRKFPVMYLDGLDVPPDGQFEIPEGKLFSWVPARDLRRFNSDDPESQSVRGFGAAQAFRERIKKMVSAEDYRGHADVSFRASYASDQHVQYNCPAQDANGPTPLATSSTQARPINVPAMPELNSTSNNEPERSGTDDTGVGCSVGHETGNDIESAHDGHAHTHQRAEIGEIPTGLRLQPQAFPNETSGEHSPNTPMMASTPRESSVSSVVVGQGPYPKEARQASSRPSTTQGDPSSAAITVQGPLSPLRIAHQVSRAESNSIVAPSLPAQVRLSSDHSNDPRNQHPHILQMLKDGNGDHTKPVASAEESPSAQTARRPLGESGTRTTAPPRARTPDWPEAVSPVPARLDPKIPRVANRDHWQVPRADLPGHFGTARPSSPVPAQPSPRSLLCGSNLVQFHHVPTGKNLSPPHAPAPLPSPSALLSLVGQERVSERDLISGTSLPSFGSLAAQDHPPLEQPFKRPLPRTSLLRRLLPNLNSCNHNNESSLAGHDGLYPCPTCGRKFNRIVVMDNHIRDKHGIEPPPRETEDW